MDKVIIIKGNQEENILDKLFEVREEEIEKTSPERTAYIKENNLKDVTQDSLIEEIENITNIDKTTKKSLIEKLDKLLENRNRIQSFDCRTYYIAGISDVVNIILNR